MDGLGKHSEYMFVISSNLNFYWILIVFVAAISSMVVRKAQGLSKPLLEGNFTNINFTDRVKFRNRT